MTVVVIGMLKLSLITEGGCGTLVTCATLTHSWPLKDDQGLTWIALPSELYCTFYGFPPSVLREDESWEIYVLVA